MTSLSDLLERTAVFRGLDPTQRAALVPLFAERTFEPDAVMMREGERDPHVYILSSGRAEIVKATPDGAGAHVLKRIAPGESVGEMKLADDAAPLNSATVVARDRVVAWSLPLPALDSVAPAIRARLTANVAKILAERLRSNNETAVEAMQHELEQSRERVAAGIFAISLIAITSVYNLAVAGLKAANPATHPREAFLSPVFILTPCIPMIFLIRASHHPAREYGLRLTGWLRDTRDAVLYTLPVLGLVTVLKAVWIHVDPRLAGKPLFDPTAMFEDGRFDLRVYLLATLAYVIVCPAQEFFTRSGLQTALDWFLPRRDGRANWPAIVVSNLVFALAHTFIGFTFAVAAFLPGLFWGWLFDRQRSLVSVSISHAIVGVWSLQVLGVQPIIGGH
jgi:CRP-like cAMP-binding protein